MSASDRSSGTSIASGSSSDGGPMFPEPVTLLSTPNATPYGYNQQDSPNAVKRPGLWTLFAEGSPVSPPPPPADGRESQTVGGYGPSSPVSLASYDPATSSWRTFQVSLLSTEDERFPRSWETWPRSGMTRHGVAFALPTSAHPIGGSESSYLPTPSEAMTGGYTRDEGKLAVHHELGGHQGNELKRRIDLLHTPTTGDTNPSYDHRASPGYVRKNGVPNLAAQVDELLPTPKTPTGGSEARAGRKDRGSGGEDLEARLRSLGDLTPPPSDDGNES